MDREDAWWAVLAAGTALEVVALRRQDHEATLSRFTRRTFRTHCPLGRIAFAAFWAWFLHHILRGGTV